MTHCLSFVREHHRLPIADPARTARGCRLPLQPASLIVPNSRSLSGPFEQDHGRPKHLTKLPPHSRRNSRPNRPRTFPIA